jgi:hypothetical protein
VEVIVKHNQQLNDPHVTVDVVQIKVKPKSLDTSKPPLVSRILRVEHQMVGNVSDTRLERVMFTGHTCLENRTRVLLRKGPWLMFSHASCSYKVFQCATKGYFALLILFKEVPTPSILPALVINGK